MYLLKNPLVIIYLLTLIGCSDADMQTESVKPVTPFTSTEQTLEFKQDAAIAIFKKNHDMNHYEITDLILVKDVQFPKLKAVISYYDKKENNASNIAFIYGDGSYNICFAVNEVEGVRTFDIAEDSHLTYLGDGAVTTSIRKIDTSEIIDYKISFSQDISTRTTHFKVSSEEPREEINQVSSIIVNERQNEEYISINEVVLFDEIEIMKDLLDDSTWEWNIEVQMEYPPDYRFTLNSISYAVWITPKRNQLEIFAEGKAMYTKLPIEDSNILFKIMTGRKLSF